MNQRSSPRSNALAPAMRAAETTRPSFTNAAFGGRGAEILAFGGERWRSGTDAMAFGASVAAGPRHRGPALRRVGRSEPRFRLRSADESPDVRDLPPPAVLAERLRQERALSDRHGRPFALLVFEAGDPEFDPSTATRLTAALRRRLRATDEAGWLDRKRIAVLLPEASRHGARVLAGEICRAMPPWGGSPRFEVQTYPPPGSAHRLGPELLAPEDRTKAERNRRSRVACLEPGRMPRWKRAMDIVGSLAAMMLLAPVLVAAAILVKLSSPGPILFRQRRAGRNGTPFVLFKFRTMVDGAESLKDSLRALNEQSGPVFKIRNDPRITRLGRWLRVTSIDELPQLWNVLKGEMSLVGPRPPTLDEVGSYERWQRRRLTVTPGLTCIWQVSGRNLIGFQEWVRMDLRYIQNSSIVQDLRLLVRTIPVVLSRRGAH